MSLRQPFDFHTPWYLASSNLQQPSGSANQGPRLLSATDTVGEHLLRMVELFRSSGQTSAGTGPASDAQSVLVLPDSPASHSGSNVQEVLDDLWSSLNYVAPQVSSLSLAPAPPFEAGQVVPQVAVSFSLSGSDPVTSLSVRVGSAATELPVTSRSYTTGALSSDTDITVTASDGSKSASRSAQVRFLPRSWWGSHASPDLPVQSVSALQDSALSSSASGTYQFTSPAGFYSYLVLPDSITTSAFRSSPQVKVNGFDVQLVTVHASVPVPNQYGASPVCSVYRLSQPGLGSFSAVLP